MMIERVNELVDVMLHGDQDEVEPQQVEAILEEARKGDKQIQETAIDILFYAERTEKYFCLLKPEDKKWIEIFDNKRAASVLIVAMNTTIDDRTLKLHTEIKHADGLYHALKQAFGGLDIEKHYI